ncbi:transposase [Skermanella stibiiresistens]
MPHKASAARRRHIPQPKLCVTNWAAYNEAPRLRGSLTVWFKDDAIAAWKAAPRMTRCGQPHYWDLATH